MDIYLLAVIGLSMWALATKKSIQGARVFLIFAILQFILLLTMPYWSIDNHFLNGFFVPFSASATLFRMLVFAIEAIVLLAVSFYNLSFVQREEEKKHESKQNVYHALLIGFIGAMDLAIFSNNLGMMWVFIELSTLLSALLVAYYNTKAALEASWKYVFMCSIGIALAFTGIIFLLIATNGNLDFDSMLFDENKRFALKLAIPFLLIGFGTRVGLAPVHNWLPDAHSEAPTPVSALMSATMLNSALVPIICFVELLEYQGLGLVNFARHLLLIMGFLSLIFAAIFILKTNDFKRMLAYSSIQNLGIVVIEAGLGSAFFMNFHMVGHSLVKAALFLCAGNIVSIYGTKLISDVRGLLKVSTVNGYLWLFGLLAVMGFMPFMLFIGEFYIMLELFHENIYLAILFASLVTLVMYGIGYKLLFMLRGEEDRESEESKLRLGMSSYLPILILLLLSVAGSGVFVWLLAGGLQ